MVLQVWIFCMRQVQVVPIGFAGTFVLFSALFVLGNFQNHDGDFGQYVIQARNLLLGRPWDHLVAGLPSVPPLYSMLLAALTWFGGVNAYAYAVLNSVLWAGTAVMAFHFFRNDFKSEVTAYGFLVAVLFSPFILYFQQSGVPNILYGAGAMLALLSAKRLSEGAFRLSYALCILLPALIRSEALALYAALFLYFGLKQQWRLLILPVLGVALLIGSDLLLSLNFDLRSNFRHAASTAEGASGGWDAGRLLSAYCYMFLSYFFGFADFLFAPGITAKQAIWSLPIGQFLFRVGPLAIVIASIFGAGVLIHRRYLSRQAFLCCPFGAHFDVPARRRGAGALSSGPCSDLHLLCLLRCRADLCLLEACTTGCSGFDDAPVSYCICCVHPKTYVGASQREQSVHTCHEQPCGLDCSEQRRKASGLLQNAAHDTASGSTVRCG
jgi:hypothetical protein